jgi:hypothetical protein
MAGAGGEGAAARPGRGREAHGITSSRAHLPWLSRLLVRMLGLRLTERVCS